MNDVVLDNLKKFNAKYPKSVYALRDWKNINSKDFSLLEALNCVYLAAYGHFDEMAKIIQQLTEKKKVFGRSAAVVGSNIKTIDITKGENGKLELVGYDPDKKPMLKGQHVGHNPKIFRKSDDQVNKTYQKSEEKMYDFGKLVRDLYPDKSNQYITHAMQAIKKYAALRKVSPQKVIRSIERGRLKLKDDDYNRFEIIPESVMNNNSKVVVLSEAQVRMINEELELTEYKFYNNVKKFLSDLLADPVNARPTDMLLSNGLTRSKLLRYLMSVGLLERDEKLSDTDEFGQPKNVTMMVKFRVPKKNFDRKLRKLWIRLFERNLPPRKSHEELNEEGEGATSADASGEFVQPLFGVQRRKMPSEVEEATATITVGNYEYDVPFAGDDEALKRKNGIGGSVSVNLE